MVYNSTLWRILPQQRCIMHNFQATTTRDKQTIHKTSYAWVILGVVYFASMAAPLNQAKVPPIMPYLIEAFQMNLGNAGMLMSVFAITGVFLALPAGFILQRIGLKTTGLIALSSLIFGSILGAVAISPNFMLLSRVIEGIGMGFMTVLAPAAIAMWFPSKNLGLPMSIWATWVPFGTIVMLILAPFVATRSGWQMVWWISAIFSLFMFALYALLIRTPAGNLTNSNTHQNIGEISEISKFWKALANKDIWLMGCIFACFTFTGSGWSSFYPTFLASERGFSLANASLVYSLSTVMSIFSCLIAGIVSDRIGSRRLIFTLPAIPLAVLPALLFLTHGGWIPLLLVIYGLLVGAIPTAIFSAVPEVMGNPQEAGVGLAVVTLGQNVGFLLGPAFFGWMASHLNWMTASLGSLPVMLLAFLIGWKVNIR